MFKKKTLDHAIASHPSSVSAMSSRVTSPPELCALFAFNSTYGKGEDCNLEKLLFYYPISANDNTKKDAVGLSQAIINFTRPFSDEKPVDIYKSKLHKKGFYECEDNVWIVIDVRNAVAATPSATTTNGIATTPASPISNDLVDEHAFPDAALHTILKDLYAMIRLFHGSIRSMCANPDIGVVGVRKALGFFVERYGKYLSLSGIDLPCVLDGLQFLPVDKHVFLSIQYFINLCENAYPEIERSAILFDGQVVWSGIEQDDMWTLYKYILRSRGSSYREMRSGLIFAGSWPKKIFYSQKYEDRLPVYLSSNGSPTEVERTVLVYEMHHSTILFMVHPDVASSEDFVKKIKEFIGGEVAALSRMISDQYIRVRNFEEQFRYIYFNKMNLAMKSSLRQRNYVLSADVRVLLARMHHDLTSTLYIRDAREIWAKTGSDGWVVAKSCNDRQLYIIVDSKNMQLPDVVGEVEHVVSAYFSNVLM